MRFLFLPGIKIIGAMRFTGKFTFIGAIIVFSFVVFLNSIVTSLDSTIDFSRKENYGVQYLRPLLGVLKSMQSIRLDFDTLSRGGETNASISAEFSKIDSHFKEMSSLDEKYGQTLKSTEKLTSIKVKFNSLKSDLFVAGYDKASNKINSFVSDCLTLIIDVADTSNLTLDPDVDTYYLMDSSMTKLPSLIECCGQLVSMGTFAAQKKKITADERTAMVVTHGLMRSNSEGFVKNMQRAFEYNADLKIAMEPVVNEFNKKMEKFDKNFLNDVISTFEVSVMSESISSSGKTIINNAFDVYDKTIDKLYELIEVRVTGFVDKKYNMIRFTSISFLVLIYFFVSFYLTTAPVLRDISNAAVKISHGDISRSVKYESGDELGDLSTSFTEMTDYIREISAAAEKIGKGDLSINVTARSNEDVLSRSIMNVSTSLKGIIGETKKLSASALSGEIETRADSSRFNGAYSDLCVSINDILDVLLKTIRQIAQYTATLAGSSEELSAVSRQMSTNAESTSRGVIDVLGASEQSQRSVQMVAAGTEEMSSSIKEIARNTNEAVKIAASGVSFARNTNEIVSKLGDSSAEIGKVIKVINSIAEQTNLLALNATIEAARAGEAGKGFAVVANEVKELAKETARATEDISAKIEKIQNDTRESVNAIGNITAIINQINDFQSTIASAVEQQTATTNEISHNLEDVAAGSNNITKSVNEVSIAARSTASGAGDTLKAANDLARIANELQDIVSGFKIKN